MKRLLYITLSCLILLVSEVANAQCCGNGICEVGEDSLSCPSDCGSVSFHCPGLGTINSVSSSPTTGPNFSYPASVANGYCNTIYPPYPSQVCFEFQVPSASAPMFFSMNVKSFGSGSCNFTSSPNTGFNGAGGCASFTPGFFLPNMVTGTASYDQNCNLIGSNIIFGNISTGGCSFMSGIMAPGDIITFCMQLNTAALCDSFSFCPTFYCGTEDCSTSGSPSCPPFNFKDSTYIDQCSQNPNSGIAIITPDCGSNYSYLWNDAFSQTDSIAINLPPGTYDVLITNDSFACDTIMSVVIDPLFPSKTITLDISICEGDSVFAAGDFQLTTGLYSDTLFTFKGCDSIINTDLTVNPLYKDSVYISICEGDSLLIGTVFRKTQGSYPLTYKTKAGCDSIVITKLALNPTPTLIVNEDTSIQFGEKINLEATGGFSFLWTPNTWLSCDDCPSPISEPEETITYQITSTSDSGCQSTDTVRIEVIKEPLEFYSSFSPNDDGENDIWRIKGIYQYPSASVKIYNRWGRTVYERDNNYDSNEWTGTNDSEEPVSSSVYYYIVDLKNGSDVFTGTITIIL